MGFFIGQCFIAIIISIIAFLLAGKGKASTILLIVGIVLYAIATFGGVAGGSGISPAYILSIILMAIMIFVCSNKGSKNN